MFYKVKQVVPLDDFVLLVFFENGATKKYDIKRIFKRWESFEILKTAKGLYKQVKVDTGGYGVSWNDDLDLACNELYFNGKEN